ncbi:MAG: bacitracin resistance protein [Cryobacterium sp.]
MTDAAQAPTTIVRPSAPTTPQWLVVTISVFFGLFFAYDMWEAIGNLVGLNAAAQSLDTRLSGFGWAVLIAGVILPVLVFGIAFWLGRRRAAAARAMLLLVGLCLIAVLSLDIFMFGLGGLIV